MKIDDMQFAFLPGTGTTDALFMVRQLQHNKMYFVFVDLEKAFDSLQWDVLWLAMHKLVVSLNSTSHVYKCQVICQSGWHIKGQI